MNNRWHNQIEWHQNHESRRRLIGPWFGVLGCGLLLVACLLPIFGIWF